MDLGLNGKKGIVCAASKGLGRGCAMALAGEGVKLVINSRDHDRLEQTADEIRSVTGATVITVAGDIATEQTRSDILAACPAPDILVNNAGGPPPGDFRDWGRDDWIRAVDNNMLTPIELIKAVIDGMIVRRFGRIVNITSSAVKAPIDVLGLSNGARTGLTGFVAGLARTAARHNVTINNLLPGAFATERMTGVTRAMAEANGLDPDAELERRRLLIPAERFGDPREFGHACAFLCSADAGYLVGHNLLLDGGAYPGTM